MDISNNIGMIVIGSIAWLVIMYYLISSAVSSGIKEQTKLLKKQNDILLKMLNEQGISKQELSDTFLEEKKALWPGMKNYDVPKSI